MENYVRKMFLKKPLPTHSYLHQLPAVRFLKEHGGLDFPSSLTFLVGENGTGKSTLLEGLAITLGFNPEGGTRNFNFHTHDSHSELHTCLSVIRGPYQPRDSFFLRAESVYNLATNIDEIDFDGTLTQFYGGRSLHQQSHGEGILNILQNRLSGQGLYLLDEPETALSPARQLALMACLHRLLQDRSQLIVATHSPLLLTLPGAAIYELDEEGIHPRSSYTETACYSLTRRFLDHPDSILHYLLEKEE